MSSFDILRKDFEEYKRDKDIECYSVLISNWSNYYYYEKLTDVEKTAIYLQYGINNIIKVLSKIANNTIEEFISNKNTYDVILFSYISKSIILEEFEYSVSKDTDCYNDESYIDNYYSIITYIEKNKLYYIFGVNRIIENLHKIASNNKYKSINDLIQYEENYDKLIFYYVMNEISKMN